MDSCLLLTSWMMWIWNNMGPLKKMKKGFFFSSRLQTGFLRTSMSVLLEVSGPTLRLERRDSRRDLTAGRTTRFTGASAAAWSHSSSTTVGSSVGSEERLHVEGSGVLTSSRISSLDLGALLECPGTQAAPAPSSAQRLSFSTLPPADDLLSQFTTGETTAGVTLQLSVQDDRPGVAANKLCQP